MKNIQARHPTYEAYRDSWQQMRDAIDGEDVIKSRGETYLPMKTGIAALTDKTAQSKAYAAYKERAEYPELTEPTIMGCAGVMLDRDPVIDLPASMEHLRERATIDGLPLVGLLRRIVIELLSTGRYGLLPGIDGTTTYISYYPAESITNWDSTNGVPDYVVLDESGLAMNRETNVWSTQIRYREVTANEAGQFGAFEWSPAAADAEKASPVGKLAPGVFIPYATPKNEDLKGLPFTFIGAIDLKAEPDGVPLYGLAKLCRRYYRIDADYQTAMHNTSEPTPVVTGYDDPAKARKAGSVPTGIGASTLWILPKGATAEYLEFSGAGIKAQREAMNDILHRAASFGARLMVDNDAGPESGAAVKTRLGSQTASLKTILSAACAGLQRALRQIAAWSGADPEAVTVTPHLDMFDRELDAQEITALVTAWEKSAFSWSTLFARLQKGGAIRPDRTEEDERKDLDEEAKQQAEDGLGEDLDDESAALLPPSGPGRDDPEDPPEGR